MMTETRIDKKITHDTMLSRNQKKIIATLALLLIFFIAAEIRFNQAGCEVIPDSAQRKQCQSSRAS